MLIDYNTLYELLEIVNKWENEGYFIECVHDALNILREEYSL